MIIINDYLNTIYTLLFVHRLLLYVFRLIINRMNDAIRFSVAFRRYINTLLSFHLSYLKCIRRFYFFQTEQIVFFSTLCKNVFLFYFTRGNDAENTNAASICSRSEKRT